MKQALVVLVCLAGLGVGGVRTTVRGAVYPRYHLDRKANGFMLMGAEATVEAQVTSRTRDILIAVVQLAGGSTMAGWTRGFHFGEAYALLPLGLGWPTVRVGQAVIPFGLLADYDTHSQVIQTPYARTLGLRLDPGLGLLGTLGPADYSVWISNGNGPYVEDNDRNKAITTRIAPTFLLGDAELTVGLSGLAGSLPYWCIDSLGQMPAGPQSYVSKYRLGLDNTTDWGPATFRLEGVVGKDSSSSGPLVAGYYAEARYAFGYVVEAVVKYDGFHAEGRRLNAVGAGLNLYPPDVSAFEVQTLYEREWSDMMPFSEGHWHVAAQLVVRL